MTLESRHNAIFPSWMSTAYQRPIELVRGSGVYVEDRDGNRYLDFFGGVLTNSLGYGVDPVSEAVISRIKSGLVHSSTLYLDEKRVELAERIAATSDIPNAKVFFCNSGSEANETALMIATRYRNSNSVIAISQGYHGRTFGTSAVTGNRFWSSTSLSPFNVSFLTAVDRIRGRFSGLSDPEIVRASVSELRQLLDTTSFPSAACLIAEPILGVGGFLAPPDGYFREIRNVLDESGILWISDEVQTGMGRTGQGFWGYQVHRAIPDVITFAKGVGNGFALAGVVARSEVIDSIDGISFSTFGGDPIAVTAGSAVLDFIEEHDLQHSADVVGQHLMEGLREIGDEFPEVVDVRGKGLMVGIEFVENPGGQPSGRLAQLVMEQCKEERLLVGIGGLYRNVIRLGPPLTLTTDEAYEAVRRIDRALKRVFADRSWLSMTSVFEMHSDRPRTYSRVAVIGGGRLATSVCESLSLTISGELSVVVCCRSLARSSEISSAANLRARGSGSDVVFRPTSCDFTSSEKISSWLGEVRPEVLLICGSYHSLQEIEASSSRWVDLVRSVEFGFTLPLQAKLALDVSREVKRLGLCTIVLNGCFPDLVNPIIVAHGFPVLCGFGNSMAVQAAILESLSIGSASRLQVLAHHSHLREIGSSDLEARVWLDGLALGSVRSLLVGLRRLPKRWLSSIAGANAAMLVRALIDQIEVSASVPGPNGLPGGYPVVLSGDTLDLSLPGKVSLGDAIEWNREAGRIDGVFLSDELVEHGSNIRSKLRGLLPDYAEGYAIDDISDVAERLLSLRSEFRR